MRRAGHDASPNTTHAGMASCRTFNFEAIHAEGRTGGDAGEGVKKGREGSERREGGEGGNDS